MDPKPDLSFTNSFIFMINKNYAYGGDIIYNNGLGGESIYGKAITNENYKLKHTVPYLISTHSPDETKTSTS